MLQTSLLDRELQQQQDVRKLGKFVQKHQQGAGSHITSRELCEDHRVTVQVCLTSLDRD